ncbi:hypothetical protein [Cellulomonas sp.]|uniref:hypothetical protein n=1 Tax=Cellulomonas sp. TaxID=40001 RepID=UPI003BA8F74B
MTWAQRYLNGNLSVADSMDWEVAPGGSPWRIDIMVDESQIFEVKRWANGTNVAAVSNQLNGYVSGAAGLGVAATASAELVGWADMFVVYSGMFDFSPDRVVVWGGENPVGAVWFDTEDKVDRNVRLKANLKYNQEELGRQLGVPFPFPIPVPVTPGMPVVVP